MLEATDLDRHCAALPPAGTAAHYLHKLNEANREIERARAGSSLRDLFLAYAAWWDVNAQWDTAEGRTTDRCRANAAQYRAKAQKSTENKP
jgi:hypothetical protein